VLPASRSVDLIGHVVFAVGAVALLGVAALRLHEPAPDDLAPQRPAGRGEPISLSR
jgi:hypothetical protein